MKKRKAVKKTAAKKHTTKKSQAKSKRAATTAAKRKALNGRRKKSRVKSARSRKAKAKTVRGKALRKKSATVATKKRRGERVLGRRPTADPREFSRGEVASRQAGQSGDIQGLSNRAGADSESIEELIDEGNAFEADAVEGVERAGNSTREVRTRQVPEDDVPGEYLDED